jgi:hypothetical protein
VCSYNSSFLYFFLLLLQCTAPGLNYISFFLSVLLFFFCLIFLKVFFYKNETKKNHFCHLLIYIVCFYMKPKEFICARRPVNSVCVVDRSVFCSLFSSLDCFDNQHQSLPSIIFLCVHTHIISCFFVFFSSFEAHTHIILTHLFFKKQFFFSSYLIVVLLMLIVILFFSFFFLFVFFLSLCVQSKLHITT